jgi:hypothetical protein
MKSKISRNDPCPCGSGKKYKNCHENKENKNTSRVPLILGVIFIIALGIFLINPNQNLKSSGGKPGQVWSEEHGHWHDAPSAPATTTPPAQEKATQPTSTAPEGKVWSEEHGHWHDAPSASTTSTTPAQEKPTRPPGPAPEGKVWSEEHGHWHNAPVSE